MSHLYCSITSAQQQIALAVSRGSHFWTAGRIPIEKYPQLVEKFAEKYGTKLSRGRRGYRRERGLANATLVACYIGGEVLWWLLVTDGKHPAKFQENLRDAREQGQRLNFGQDYVLIYCTRPKMHGGGSRWTWYLSRECEMGDASALAKIAQEGNAQSVERFCETLLHRPLHSGVRSQTTKMIRRAIVIWKKHHASIPWPGANPSNLPIMTFKAALPRPSPTREEMLRKLDQAFSRMDSGLPECDLKDGRTDMSLKFPLGY